jgi:hypothetical protein
VGDPLDHSKGGGRAPRRYALQHFIHLSLLRLRGERTTTEDTHMKRWRIDVQKMLDNLFPPDRAFVWLLDDL